MSAGFAAELAALEREQRLGALSRRDSLELVRAHPPSWRVRGILASDDYGVLAGPKGVGKTYALLDLAVSSALGEPWFGRFETEQTTVLVLTSEDSRARIWRRIDAIARSRGRDPEELEGRLYVHPFSFSVVDGLHRLEAELEVVEPGFVLVDPAYRYLPGVRAQLFDMGAALTPLQEACTSRGASLLVGHHFNRREGAAREERISGAGLLEWSRVVMTVDAPPRRDDDPEVVLTFEITGNSIDPLTFRVRRRVEALSDGPDAELLYSAEVVAEGAAALEARYATAAERVLAILPARPEEALTVREIGDLVAHDATGKGGLKSDTIRKVLNRDLAGRVDCIEAGDRSGGRWWRT
ncbi:MAG TPA: AAA family ATPase [Actinomycetota bacterium]|nr:AAA family ATPase [Actinomycetota bacterium]